MNNEYYNSVSDFELQKGGYYPQKILFFEKVLNELKNNSDQQLSILDLACNDGKLSMIYSKYGMVTGIDLNEAAITEARAAGINAIRGDVLSLAQTFSGDKFDVVIAGDIIEHIFDTNLFLQNIHAILRNGGTLLISTPNVLSLGRRLMAIFGENPFCEYSCEKNGINVGHIRYYTYRNLQDQLSLEGFGSIKISTDTINFPISVIDRLMVKFFPKLGRELLAKCQKK